MKNIAIYSRKSCVTDTGESIVNQINMCKEYVFAHVDKCENCNLIVYRDEGFSAKNTDRPEFKKMMKDAEDKRFSYIVCYRLDRISRNVGDFSKLVEKFKEMGVSFICVKEQFDTSVPMGRAMMYIASVFAQLERETIAERVRDNMIMLSKRGQWLGGTTPLGMKSYKIVDKSSDSNSKYKFYLKTDPKEIDVVKKIYYKFLECKSLTKTKQYLEALNIKSKFGNNFSATSIKKILTNPVYCSADIHARDYFEKTGAEICFSASECDESTGIIAYNKRNYRENSGKINPMENWIITKGCHKSVVNGKIWSEINEFLNNKKYKKKSGGSLLCGKIICKICNSKMLQKRRHGGTNYDYICASKIYNNSAKKCPCNNINGCYTDALAISRIIADGIKNNPFFIEKLKVLASALSRSTKPNVQKSPTPNDISRKIIKNIKKNTQIYFVNKVIEEIFWDNTTLTVKLKNCH